MISSIRFIFIWLTVVTFCLVLNVNAQNTPEATPPPLDCTSTADLSGEVVVRSSALGSRTKCTLPTHCRAVLSWSVEKGMVILKGGYRIQPGVNGTDPDTDVPAKTKETVSNITQDDGEEYAKRLISRASSDLNMFGCAISDAELGSIVFRATQVVSASRICINTADPECVQLASVGICTAKCAPSPTPTPSTTPTPSVTPTPSTTPTPSMTPTPSKTPTPSTTPTPSPSPAVKCSSLTDVPGEKRIPSARLGPDVQCDGPNHCRAILSWSAQNGTIVLKGGYRVQPGIDGTLPDMDVSAKTKEAISNITPTLADEFAKRLIGNSQVVLNKYGCKILEAELSAAVFSATSTITTPGVCLKTSDPECVQLTTVGSCAVKCAP